MTFHEVHTTDDTFRREDLGNSLEGELLDVLHLHVETILSGNMHNGSFCLQFMGRGLRNFVHGETLGNSMEQVIGGTLSFIKEDLWNRCENT